MLRVPKYRDTDVPPQGGMLLESRESVWEKFARHVHRLLFGAASEYTVASLRVCLFYIHPRDFYHI